MRTYPKFIFFNIILIKVAMELAKLKDAAIRELTKRNGDLFETQKVILNSMTQGIALTCKNRGQDQTFFLNSSIKKMLAGIVESFP